MSAVSAPQSSPANSPPANSPPATRAVSRNLWIVGSWVDVIFIVLTPLLAVPAILFVTSSHVSIKAETISLIVTAFFATGHHLPGLIRAYGDRELFERFRWRFLLAPPIVFLAYFPAYTYHFSLYRLIILSWATWHGLMQLYGFVRIYDAKVGSVSRTTAYWDWLLCLCAFVTPQLLRPEQLSNILGHWYACGGPFVSVKFTDGLRWTALAISVFVLIGFSVNFTFQWFKGPRPGILKLVMLASGIGLWWFAILGIDNLLISIALFDICHDVQYLAIVWLINCRRAGANADLGWFMRYVFRRGMVLLYLGLIVAYGAIAFTGQMVLDGTVRRIFYGVIFTSTVLHYYYDGFIWKVRESTNQASLGLTQNPAMSRWRSGMNSGFGHFLKCAPILGVLGFLFAMDFIDPPLTTAHTDQLEQRYVESLLGSSSLPASEEEQSWLYSRFEQVQNLAKVVPDDRHAQLRSAIMLANFGRNNEAVDRLERLVKNHPDFFTAQLSLGGILSYLGENEMAADHLAAAATLATTPEERSASYRKWGEVELIRDNVQEAENKFKIAIENDPDSAALIDAFRKSQTAGNGIQ